MERQALRERYEQLDWPQQLGNLASTLARISSRASDARHDDLVADLLREMLAWRRAWPLDPIRSILVLHARNTSDRLLRMAGLSPQPTNRSTH